MRFRLALITTVLFVALASIGIAQSIQPVKVSGSVFDPNGAVIPRVTMTLKNASTEEVLRINTDEGGRFAFDSVRPGIYELTAQTFFFEKLSKSISIAGEKDNKFDLTLELPHCPDHIKRLSEEEKSRVTVCELHHEQLKIGVVPIEYGLIIVPDDSPKNLFPNSRTIYFGGCVSTCYEKAEVLFCPVCRELEYQWNKEHLEYRKWPKVS